MVNRSLSPRSLLAAAVGSACLLAAPRTRAQAPPPPPVVWSDYEREAVELVTGDLGLTVDSHPEGKRVGSIVIRVLDVVEDRDPAPNFLNIFHANTRDYVVRRELLFREGEPFNARDVRESERNLRALRQLSLVLLVPVRSKRAGRVDILVIAKDIWSLRLNSNYRFKNGNLEYLFLQPSEENLAGTHRRVQAAFTLQPDTYSFGLSYIEPRIVGSRYLAAADANIIVNRETGAPEGSYGSVQYGLPLYSTHRRWSWGAVAQWRTEVTRLFTGVTLRTYDADATPDVDDQIPFVYNTDIIAGRFSFTRSFGYAMKQDVQVGVGASRAAFSVAPSSAFDPAAMAEFVSTQVPVSDTQNGPFVQYHLFLNQFRQLLDIETVGLQEDYRLGPDVYLRASLTPKMLGSTRNVIGWSAGVGNTVGFGDGFARVHGAGSIEVDVDAGQLADSLVELGTRVVTPRLPVGRLIYDATLSHRPNNYLNSRVTLGGDGRLRGYPSSFFIGKDLVASNLEYRSRPLLLWTVYVQGVAFYDVGDAFDGFDELRVHHGAGFGARLLFPQLERTVMRVDWGFAINPPVELSPFDGLVLTFRQAFGVPYLTGTGVSTEP